VSQLDRGAYLIALACFSPVRLCVCASVTVSCSRAVSGQVRERFETAGLEKPCARKGTVVRIHPAVCSPDHSCCVYASDFRQQFSSPPQEAPMRWTKAWFAAAVTRIRPRLLQVGRQEGRRSTGVQQDNHGRQGRGTVSWCCNTSGRKPRPSPRPTTYQQEQDSIAQLHADSTWRAEAARQQEGNR